MEVWRADVIEGRRPALFSRTNFVLSFLLHIGGFLAIVAFAWLHGIFEPKETVIPIDLTVVVNENLDGVENEPPPLKNPDPPPPPQKTKSKPKPEPKKVEPPKPLEQMVIDDKKKKVEKKDPPKKEPPKKEPPKKEEPKKEEKPKKTAKELREERIKAMRGSAVKNTKPVKIEVKNAKESGNGKTVPQPRSQAEIEKLLGLGYKPGTSNQIAESDLQLGVSLVQMALDAKWDALSPKVGASGTVLLSCRFNSSGGLIDVKIATSCGDSLSDQAALSVARAISAISNLPEKFKARFMKETLTIRYKVNGR